MRTSINAEKRCNCGTLLAVLCEEGVEIKCRRCKRFHKLTLKDLEIAARGLISPEPSQEKPPVICGRSN